MKISDNIERNVITINENQTALDAAALMTEKYVGSVIITGDSKIKGIFTERDLMMQVVGVKKDPAKTKIKDVMPQNTAKVSSNATFNDCLEQMKQYRCRHLLVFDGNNFIGLISLRDVVEMMIKEKEGLISQLNQYITG